MSLLSQAFPPAPTYTEKSLPSLSSKTYIVTGGPSGIGFELAKILYSRSATVYLAARNPIKITEAIEAIDSAFPESTGRLEPFVVDLSDLTTVPIAAKAFKERNSKLDGLVLNAAVMVPPVGSRSKQGYELQMATNCLGGHLLLKCLEEVLINTAKTSAPGDVRVVWVSTILEFAKGVVWDEAKDEPKLSKNQMDNYVTSKVGDVFLAQDTADRLGKYGIIAMVSGSSCLALDQLLILIVCQPRTLEDGAAETPPSHSENNYGR